MKNTGECEESILMLIGIGALRAAQMSMAEDDPVEELRARRIFNEVSILLRKKEFKL